MDLRNLQYLVEIVNNKMNLSETAKRIHLSQPALSQAMKKMEDEFGGPLFVRYKGQLSKLSVLGESVFHDALIVLEAHQALMDHANDLAASMSGRIRIGIPPLILSILFSEILSDLMLNGTVRIEIAEEGANELKKKLVLNEIDCAILLRPTDLPEESFENELLYRDELKVFMSKDHPLAEKDHLVWSDLRRQKLALFDDTYMIHHLIKRKLFSLNIPPNIVFTSKSWDFLLESVKHSDSLTILPAPISSHYNLVDIVSKDIQKPLLWEVALCYPKKKTYLAAEKKVFEQVSRHFSNK
ncbi:LysR family transcriptional regulator [Guggenheimella bovis]